MNKFFLTKNRDTLFGWLLGIITLLLYLPTLSFDFLNYDDSIYVYENPYVTQGLTPAFFKSFLTARYDFWIPLTLLSHALNWQIFGNWAGGHHLSNILLHTFNTLLVFALFRTMSISSCKAFLIAAIFAWHPIKVESVAWVTERKDVLSTFFILISMLTYTFYTKKRSFIFLLLCFIFFIFSILSKPSYIILPFLLICLDFWPLERKEPLKKIFFEKAPLLFFSIICCYINLKYQHFGQAFSDQKTHTFIFYIAVTGQAFFHYILLFLWPAKLSILSIYYPSNFHTLDSILIVILLGAITVLLFSKRKTMMPFWAGWCIFGFGILPALSLATLGVHWVSSRYLYWPSVGLSIMIIWGIEMICIKTKFSKNLTQIIILLTLGALLASSSLYLRFWKNSYSIFMAALKVDPLNWRAHINISNFLSDLGQNEQSAEHFLKAINLNPSLDQESLSPTAFYYLAQAAWKINDKGQTLAFLHKAQQKQLAMNPNSVNEQLITCIESIALNQAENCGFNRTLSK